MSMCFAEQDRLAVSRVGSTFVFKVGKVAVRVIGLDERRHTCLFVVVVGDGEDRSMYYLFRHNDCFSFA